MAQTIIARTSRTRAARWALLLWAMLPLSGCASAEYEGDAAGECGDGADNDRNGLFDCFDAGCAGAPDCDASEPEDSGRPDTADTGDDTSHETGDTSTDSEDTGDTADSGTDTGGETGDTGGEVPDADGDGYTIAAGDCDDADPAVNPSAAEVWYDGVDADCDGADDFDADGDGAASDAYGGTDCDDTDGAVGPAAIETPGDGVDQDCDGDVCDKAVIANGSALSFDGDGDTVRLDSIDTLGGGALTIEAWIFYDGSSDYMGRIVTHRSASDWTADPFSMQIATGDSTYPDSLEFGYTDGSGRDGGWGVASASPVTVGAWSFVAATYDAATYEVRVYINGVEEGADTGPYAATTGDLPLWLGGDQITTERAFGGTIDEVAIFDHVRTAGQIGCDFVAGNDGSEAGTLLAWRMEEGSGDTVADASGNGWTGRLGSVTGSDSGDPAWTTTVHP